MKKRIIIFTIFFIFSHLTIVFAQTALKAEVDKKQISTDEFLTYKLTITSTEKKIPLAQLPKFEGFTVVSQAQSSKVSIAKNQIKTILIYTYLLVPTDIGKFTIEPSSIKIKNAAISSEAFEIEVKPGKVKPQPKPEEVPPSPEKPQLEPEESQVTL